MDRTVAVRLRAEYQQAVQGLNAVAGAADKTAGSVQKATSSLNASSNAQAKAGAAMGQTANRVTQTESKFTQMTKAVERNREAWSTAGTVLTVFGGSITAVGVAAAKTGIQYNQLQQQARAGLKTMLGSAEQANAQMDRLDAFAKTSPFAKQTFIKAQQQMLAFGVETKKVIPYLDAVQDAVAAAGGDNNSLAGIVEIMAKIQSSSKITAEDLNQFGNWGVNAADLIGSQMGKTGAQIREEISGGALDAGKALDALADGMKSRYEGAAANVKQTFSGAFDRVKSAWRDLSSDLMEPFVGKNGGGAAVAGLNELADAMRGFQNLPEPIKLTAAGLTTLTGAAAAGVGGFALLAPRIVETRAAFKTLAGQGGVVGGAAKAIDGVGAVAAANKGKIIGLIAAVTAFIAVAKAANDLAMRDTSTVDPTKTLDAIKSVNWANINSQFEKLIIVGNDSFTAVNDFGSALDRVFNAKSSDNINDFFTTWNSAVGGSEKVREAFGVIGDQMKAAADTGNLEQAQKVFAKMTQEAKGHNVTAQQLLDIMPSYKKGLEDMARDANMKVEGDTAMKIATGNVTAEMIKQAQAAGGNADAINKVKGVSEAAAKAQQELEASIRNASAGFVDFTKGLKDQRVSVKQYLDDLNKQIVAQGQWQANLRKLADRGMGQEAIEKLRSLGPEGAQIVKKFADGSETNIERMNGLWDKYSKHVGDANKSTREMKAQADKEYKLRLEADAGDLRTKIADATKRLDTLKAKKSTPKVDADIKELEAKLKRARTALQAIRNKTVYLTVKETHEVSHSSGNKVYKSAAGTKMEYFGNVLEPMAKGGLRSMNPIAQMVPPNTWRVVGDRMDVPEAFVPLDGSVRSWKILMEAMNRMPGMIPMANGGLVNSAQSRVKSLTRQLSAAKRAKAKDSRITALEKSLDKAKTALDKAKYAKEKADQRAQEARERAQRVGELRSDARTDLRRGSIRESTTGGLSGAYSTVDRLRELAGNKDLTRRQRQIAGRNTGGYEKALKGLYSSLDKLETKLDKAKSKLDELKSIQSSVANDLLGDRKLDLGTYNSFQNGKWTSTNGAKGAAQRLTADVGKMKAFAGKLNKLQKMGLPGSILQEIASAGMEDGSDLADSFLNASAKDVASYKGAWSDYEKYANQAGSYVTNGYYKGGVNAAQGLVNGLTSQQKQVEAAILKMAKAMESQLKKALGIHSPSTVMADLAQWVPAGVAVGITDNLGVLEGAAGAMTAAMTPSVPSVSAPAVDSTSVATGPVGVGDMTATTESTQQTMADAQQAVTDAYTVIGSTTATTMDQVLAKVTGTNAGLLANTNTTQATLLANTQTHQKNLLTNTQTHQKNLLTNTQTQYEAMRASATAKISAMRSGIDSTMGGLKDDYSGRMGALKELNRDGFASMERAGKSAFSGIRSGMNSNMSGARPELGGKLNSLIGIFSKFTNSVNGAFGDVGVKLKTPQPLKYATGTGQVLPGYSPGHDNYEFVSQEGIRLGLGGGEGIARPEVVKGMGRETWDNLNAVAARKGVSGVRQYLAYGGENLGDFMTGGVIPEKVSGAQAWAKSQVGKPYTWGGVGPGGYDCCLVGETMVSGPNGVKRIDELNSGDIVYSFVDGRMKANRVTAAWFSKTQEVFRVRTHDRAVVGSANHPFLVVTRDNEGEAFGGSRAAEFYTTWKRLDELKPGDWIVESGVTGAGDPDPVYEDGTPISKGAAWLMGAILGDGTLTDRQIRLCFFGEDRELAIEVVRTMSDCTPIYNESAGVIFGDKMLVEKLDALGLRERGANKRVPAVVESWPVSHRRAFLDGFCDADGHRPANPVKHGQRTYSSISWEMLSQVRLLHIGLGDKVSNLSTNPRKHPITINGVAVKVAQPIHTFSVWQDSAREGDVVFMRRANARRLVESWGGEFKVARVLGVTPEGVQDTYDIEVEDAHNFIADGVVVHNSGFMSAITNYLLGKPLYSRRFATGSFGPNRGAGGFVPGLEGSAFSIGVSPNTGSGIGHTAGTLGGLNVESYGGHGPATGSGARGATDKLFPWKFHLPQAGGSFIGGGGDGVSPFLQKAGINNVSGDIQKLWAKAANLHIDKAMKAVQGDLNGLPAFHRELGEGTLAQVRKGLVAKAEAYGKTMGTTGQSGNMESWRSAVAQALQITGIGSGKADEDLWLKQIMTESSGNPNLVQSSAVYDVNIARGDPARGLVQVPGVTWADFGKDQGSFIPNVYNALKNLIVGMRAANAQHSSWRNVIGKGHGYEGGTKAAKSGFAIVGERGPEIVDFGGGERVYNNADTRRIVDSGTRILASQSTAAPVSVAVSVSSDDMRKAMNGMAVTLSVDGQQMNGYVMSTVNESVTQSGRDLSRDSYYRR